MKHQLNAWRIYKDILGGCTQEHKVYTCEAVARLIAASHHEEFASHKAIPVQVRELSPEEGAVGNELVAIDRTPEEEYHRRTGLAKLSAAEKKALGLVCLLVSLLFAGCTSKEAISPSFNKTFDQVELLEQGTIDMTCYYMFRDKKTGVRMFYFNQGMVVLPPEPVERAK